MPRPEEPQVHAGRRPPRAERGDRRQDAARQRLPGQGQPGARHQRRQARGVHRVRGVVRSGRRGDLPGPVLDDLSRGHHARRWRPGGDRDRRRDRLQGHRRAARSGTHRTHEGAAVREPRQPLRFGLHTGRGRGDRANGRSSAACGWSPTRSTSTSRTAPTSSARCRRWCPTSPSSASSSTASPRRTR